MIGIGQLLLIAFILLLLFGAGRVPVIMRDIGRGVRAFREGLNGSCDLNTNSKTITSDEDVK